jgi:hypothetical protein
MAVAASGLFARITQALFGPSARPDRGVEAPPIPADSLRPTLDDAPMSAEDVMIAAVATEPIQPAAVGLSSAGDAAVAPPVDPAALQDPDIPPPKAQAPD